MGGLRRAVSLFSLAVALLVVATNGQRGLAQEFKVLIAKETYPLGERSALTFSPDSKLLVLADSSWRGMLVWDLEKDKERVFVKKQGERVQWRIECVAFSPKGDTLAVGCFRGLGLFDVATGKEKDLIEIGLVGNVKALAFAADEKSLVMAFNQIVIVWDLAGRRELRRIAGSAARDTAIAPSGDLLASYSGDVGIRLWHLDTGKQFAVLKDDSMARTESPLCFAPDGQTLAAGGNPVYLWNVTSKKCIGCLDSSDKHGYRRILAFSPDGRILALVDNDGVIHLWEIASRSIRASLRGKKKYVGPLAFSPDGRMFASGCCEDDRKSYYSIKVFDLWSIKAKAPNTKEFAAFWDTLSDESASNAFPALRTMIAFPDQTLPWLRKQLLSLRVGAEETRQQDALVADLDSGDFATREKATKKLEESGLRAEATLQRALTNRPSLELRRRVLNLLEGIDRQKKVNALQQARAVEVLEHIGTTEARAFLEELAKGVPEARLTQEVKASLARLKKRPVANR
jgi:sugar lactone lactonase YvrE